MRGSNVEDGHGPEAINVGMSENVDNVPLKSAFPEKASASPTTTVVNTMSLKLLGSLRNSVPDPRQGDEILEAPAHGFGRSLVSLFGGFCAMLAIGSVYGWGVIASQLAAFGYTPSDRLTIGTMSAFSVYVSFHTGLFYDTCGARASLFLGSVLLLLGWALTRWGIEKRHDALLIGLYQCCCGQAVEPVMLAALANVRNFLPQQRGIYSSILLAGFGLTSILMAQISERIFLNDLLRFLQTLMITTVSLVGFQLVVFAPPLPPAAVAGSSRSSILHLKTVITDRNAQLFIFVMVCFGMQLFFFVINVATLNADSHTSHNVSDLITAFGACNVLARPITGLSSAVVPLSRAQYLALGSILCAVGMALFSSKLMMSAACVVGFSDGFVFAVWVPLTREIHGSENYGITFSAYLLTFAVGDVIINFILGHTFAHFSWPEEVLGVICCILMVVASVVALLLHYRLLSAGPSQPIMMSSIASTSSKTSEEKAKMKIPVRLGRSITSLSTE